MITYSEAQALAFLTDPGTRQRGQELALPRGWAQLGRTGSAAWGACAGSGSRPYLVSLDLTEPAFKCSCPSRVFPCKHGAGLLLLLARQPELFADAPPPAWTAEWLAKRRHQEPSAAPAAAPAPTSGHEPAESAAAAPGPPAPGGPPGPDPKRQARMAAGAAELLAWLEDLVRAGLANLDQQPAAFWEGPAARLVDNQLPALAATLRELAVLRHVHADWPARLLARLGELYLLVRAFQHLPQLPPAAQADLWQLVGVTVKKDELAACALPVADTWLVLGQHQWDEDRLTARRSWLRGQGSGRYALVLEFAFGGQPFATPLVLRGRYAGELAYYPGRQPLRAAPLGLRYDGPARPHQAAGPGLSIGGLLADYAAALARQPWLREWPAMLTQVLPAPQPDGSWRLHHATEPGTLPLRLPDEAAGWQLLAESGGYSTSLFGEWDGQAFRPLARYGPSGLPAATLPTHLGPGQAAVHAAAAPAAIPVEQPASTRAAAAPAGAPPAWPALLRVALLGTRQSGEAIPAYPTPTPAREQQVLLAAGTLALLRKAGRQPGPAGVPPPAPAPAETWTLLGATGTACLRELLADRYLTFVTDFIGQAQQHRRLVPPALLVPLLQHERFRIHLPGEAAALLGERGRWLTQLNPAWQALAGPIHASQEAAAWETGSPPERRFFLEQLHQSDPARARQLLAAALPTEPPGSQAVLLGALEPALTAADAPLLTPYLASKSKDVRQTVLPLLVRLPGAALVERLWQRAAPLLATRHQLPAHPQLAVTLPEGWDKTWLADGIEQRVPDVPGGERAGWLGQLLRLLPPGRWLGHLGLASPAELLALADASEWQGLLLAAWARAAYLHRDKPWATALLLWHFEHPGVLHHQLVTHLTWVLTEAEKLALLRRQLPATGPLPPAVPGLLGYLFRPWPPDVVAAALRHLTDTLAPAAATQQADATRQLTTLLYRLARYAPAASASAARDTLCALLPQYPTLTAALDSFADLLDFRLRLDASWDEPPEP